LHFTNILRSAKARLSDFSTVDFTEELTTLHAGSDILTVAGLAPGEDPVTNLQLLFAGNLRYSISLVFFGASPKEVTP
jgi:hypothetical protein